MKNVYLFRTSTSDEGTEGMLATDGFFCKTLELPWRENQRSISCIPSGIYTVKIRQSPKYGEIYWVTGVPNRSWILIHSGNWAGDRAKGFKTHVNGCILLGKQHGDLSHMKNETFKLNVIGGF
jgi:hypothetical protein